MPSQRQIVTVHDVIALDHPEWFSKRLALFYRIVIPLLVRTAAHLIAVSTFTKDRLVRAYGAPEAKVTVIPNGVSENFSPTTVSETEAVKARLGFADRRYVLTVCSLEPRKNLSRLLQAWSLIEHQTDAILVIVGPKGRPQVFASTDSLNPSRSVMFTGYVREEDIPALYSGAACFAYPSLCEGFGLPVLEALACGAPVVTSNNSSLPEVANGHATLVDPYIPEAIAEGIWQALIQSTAERQRRSEAGQTHAREFTWQRCAEATEARILSYA